LGLVDDTCPNLTFLEIYGIIYIEKYRKEVLIVAHIVHCRVCKGKIDTDAEKNWVKPKSRMYYHTSCYDDFAKKTVKLESGEGLTIEASNDFWQNATYNYFKRDLKTSLDYRKFISQWNNFLKKGRTGKGIYFTLRYFYEIAKGDPKKSENGIGIVDYIYDEGTTYWGERNQRNKGICDRIEAQIRLAEEAERSVTIVVQKEKNKPKKTINLASIADMEDDE
jgi:hypothetical protein